MVKREIIYTKKRLLEVLENRGTVFSFDLETSPLERFREFPKAALDPHKSDITTIAFCFDETISYVVPITHKVGKNIDITGKEVFEIFHDIFKDKDITKIAYNLAFEQKQCFRFGSLFKNVADPMHMIVRYRQIEKPNLLDNGFILKGLGLKTMALEHFNHTMLEFSDTVGEGHFNDTDIEVSADYVADDTIQALKLFKVYKKLLEDIKIPELCNGMHIGPRPYKNYWEFLHNVEMPAIKSIGLMEYNGLYYNTLDADSRKNKALYEQLEAKEKIIYIAAKHGRKFTLDGKDKVGKTGKTKVVKDLLFRLLNCPVSNVSGKTGEPSLDAESISDMIHMLENNLTNKKELYCGETYKTMKKDLGEPHPFKDDLIVLLNAISVVQKNGTMINSHIDGRLKHLNIVTKRIHSNYFMYTETSRFNSSKPNAQNIPNVANDKLKVRNLYQPAPGNILVLIDYAAQEVRIAAELFKDDTMINIIKKGWDMHSFTAKSAFGLDIDLTDGSKVSKEYRNPAKPIYFTASYGGGGAALQTKYKESGIYLPKKTCQQRIDSLSHAYPGMEDFAENIVKFAEDTGYVETMLGYRRPLYRINSKDDFLKYSDERKARNTPIQGTAADVTKMALNRIYDSYIDGSLDISKVKLVATIHDEIAFEINVTDISVDDINSIVSKLKECMEKDITEQQLVSHLAEPEIADPHDVFNIGDSNGWADKYDYYEWAEKVKKG